MTAEGCIDGADVATGPLAAVLKGPAGLTGTAETAGTGATTPDGETDRVCAVSYADKQGKYQDQVGLTLPKVD